MKRWAAFVGGLCALVVVVPALAGEMPKQIGIQSNADIFAVRFAPQFGDDDFTGYGGAARANIAFNEKWNAQLDVQGQTIQFGPFTADDAGQYLHLYARDPASHAVGIYGGHATFVTPFFLIDQTTIGGERRSTLVNSPFTARALIRISPRGQRRLTCSRHVVRLAGFLLTTPHSRQI